MNYEYLGSTAVATNTVDWLTVTNPGDRDVAYDMLEVQTKLDPESKGPLKDWSFFGYRGQHYGKYSLGFRGEEAIMVFRGPMAHQALEIIPDGWKPTRLDLQASVLLDNASPVAERYFQSLGGSNRIIRPMLRFMSSSNEGGDTLYVGSRKSKQMGRVYDKGAESRRGAEDELKSGIFWRYEVELKGDLAVSAYSALKVLKGEYGDCITTFVHDWFTERGIVPAFSRVGINLVINAAVIESDEKDAVNRKVDWLVRCVRPVIEGLRVQLTDFTILEALNLTGDPPAAYSPIYGTNLDE